MSVVRLLILLFLPLVLGCTASVTDIESQQEKQSSSAAVEDEQIIPVDCNSAGENCSCELPDGTEIANGATVDMFSSAKANCGQTCAQRMQPATCENGELVRVPGHDYLSCEEAVCAACELPWGEQLAEGASIDVYRRDQVGCKENCQRSSVSCSGGRLVGANLSTYPYPSCVVQNCIQCRTPWGDMVDDGTQIRVYSAETLPCGQRCGDHDQYIRCTAGEFPDTVDLTIFRHETCATEQCMRCDTPWGTTINNNTQVSAYRNASVPCNQSCLDGGNVTSRVCVDGTLTGDSNYNYGSCLPEVCEEGGGAPGYVCRIPWSKGNALPGTEISAYTRESVDCEESCDDFRVTRKCRIEDGLWDGHPGAIYPNCTRDCRE